MDTEFAVRMVDITKHFGTITANKNVSLDIRKGEILSLLGENGSGKTTLMNMLSGIYYPDGGSIYVNGTRVDIRSPKDAFKLHIGMIHQHFKLVDVFTATENVKLGLKDSISAVRKSIVEICKKYSFAVDPDKKVYEMSVSEKQTLEIVKVLYRGADILILDEPTAVLTPQETEALFKVMRAMKADGKSIVIITHKLHEVLEISDRVAVLRKGEYIGEVETSKTDAQSLSDMMVGHAVTLNIDRPEVGYSVPRLFVKNLTVKDNLGVTRLDNVSFTANSGEILGVAGISGSGQKELLEAIAGLCRTEPGSSVMYVNPRSDEEEELCGLSPELIRDLGVSLAFVPEDRLGMGLVGSMNIPDNMMLRSYKDGKSGFADRKKPRELAQKVVDELGVLTPDLDTPIRKLSGGNVQKILVGRELSFNPSLLMAAYVVRGLDINTSYAIYGLLNDLKKKGGAVIFVGEDLDVLLELCDRILVLCGGRVSGIVDARKTQKNEVGLLMTNLGSADSSAEITKGRKTECSVFKREPRCRFGRVGLFVRLQ